jgi:hypothetical protein
MSLFVVMRINAVGSTTRTFGVAGSGGNFGIYASLGGSVLWDAPDSTSRVSGVAPTVGTTSVQGFFANGATASIRRNGSSLASRANASISITGSATVWGHDQVGNTMNVDVAEVVVYNRTLSADETSVIERYLGAKWGVALYSPPSYADADVNAYITAVEAADGQGALEAGVRDAINDFVVGCKADGIWNAIRLSCILIGARTLAGALTPLRGGAVTNNNFVSGDYNRKTGLVGNGTNKSLSQDIPAGSYLNDHSFSVFQSSLAGSAVAWACSNSSVWYGFFASTPGPPNFRSSNSQLAHSQNRAAGFIGASRNVSTEFICRNNQANETKVQNSAVQLSSGSWIVWGGGSPPTSDRNAFYHFGQSINLALLDSRVTALSNAIGAAIP